MGLCEWGGQKDHPVDHPGLGHGWERVKAQSIK